MTARGLQGKSKVVLSKEFEMSVFEAIMLICFGASWPAAVYKTYTTKNVESKSLLFMSLIILGYLAGMAHKYFNSYDFVFWLYVANLALVLCDLVLYFRYKERPAKKIEKVVIVKAGPVEEIVAEELPAAE